ncbi:MAG: hypothetical protein V3V59_09420 [Thermodesulfovibrionales bacterium]
MIDTLMSDWEAFYKRIFDIQVSLSDLYIPQECEGFDRLLIVARGITPQKTFDKCASLFPASAWTNKDLDNIVKSDRTSLSDTYALWAKDRIEPDDEYKNVYASHLKERGIPCISLEERLIYELKYYDETGAHLDLKNITLCAGSRYSNGNVPSVSWLDGKFWVYWYFPDVCCCGPLRAREVVD